MWRAENEAHKVREDKWFAVCPAINADNVEVSYGGHKYTIYGLMGQLTLDGYPRVELFGHLVTEASLPGSGGVQRYKVESLIKRWWCTNHKKRKDGEEGQTAPTPSKALAWVHDLTNIPNELVKLVWSVELVTTPQSTIRLVSPQLCWSSSQRLLAGQIFQWA